MARKNTVPFVKCECGKRGFEDEHDAEKALGKARAKRERTFAGAESRRGMYRENRTYWCEVGEVFHLTEQSRRSFETYQRPVLVAA